MVKAVNIFLNSVVQYKRADLKKLSQDLGQKGLRFASAERLQKYLRLTPGSVSPLGLIKDISHEVKFFIDDELLHQNKDLHSSECKYGNAWH